jgi:hypothetical protein
VDHLDVFREAGMDWPASINDKTLFGQRTLHLNPRPREVAFFQQFRKLSPYEESSEFPPNEFCDLVHNISWFNQSAAVSPCVVCGSIVWSTKLMKHVVGQDLHSNFHGARLGHAMRVGCGSAVFSTSRNPCLGVTACGSSELIRPPGKLCLPRFLLACRVDFASLGFWAFGWFVLGVVRY